MKGSTVVFSALLFVSCSGNKSTSTISAKAVSKCFAGKLVKEGVCGQYVVELQSANAHGLEIAAKWHDSFSSISYDNVFTVANPCDFPATIHQGQSFSFSIVSKGKNICALCEAFTPTPSANHVIAIGCKSR